MWSQATGIHSIKPSLKIDAPTPAQPPPRPRDPPTPAPSAGSTQLQSAGRQACQIGPARSSGGPRAPFFPGVVTRNKRRQLAAFRADRAIKAKLQDRGRARRRRREGERERLREREGQREKREREISNIFLVTAAFLRRVSLSNYNWLFGYIFTCEVIFSANTDTPGLFTLFRLGLNSHGNFKQTHSKKDLVFTNAVRPPESQCTHFLAR